MFHRYPEFHIHQYSNPRTVTFHKPKMALWHNPFIFKACVIPSGDWYMVMTLPANLSVGVLTLQGKWRQILYPVWTLHSVHIPPNYPYNTHQYLYIQTKKWIKIHHVHKSRQFDGTFTTLE